MNAPIRRPFDQLPPPQQAGILCNDPRFQRFAAARCNLPVKTAKPTEAAEYLRNCCQIESRRQLAYYSQAQLKFEALKTEFDAWLGRIAAQR